MVVSRDTMFSKKTFDDFWCVVCRPSIGDDPRVDVRKGSSETAFDNRLLVANNHHQTDARADRDAFFGHPFERRRQCGFHIYSGSAIQVSFHVVRTGL